MAACSKCGSAVADGASFCSICGSPVSVLGSPVAPPPPPPPAPQYQTSASAAGMSSNVAGALAYLLGLITGIIFLVMDPYKNDRFVRFHAFQSIFCSVFMIIFSIVWGIIAGMMIFSIGLFGIFSLISTLIHLAFFVLWLFLMFKAYNKEMFKIPVIGDLAEKQALK